MKAKLTQFILLSATLAGWILAGSACSTTEVTPSPAPTSIVPPPYVQVPHPAGYDLGDLRAIFTDRQAPKADDLKGCEADFIKLRSLTQSDEEITMGARELIRRDPVRYHWCFYGQILKLEADLKAENFVDVRQKKVIETYGFLTPIGRAFMQEFHDSRYMHWAIRHYRQVSEWVFYRKLEMTPRSTVDMVEASNPFGLIREPNGPKPILDKYNIIQNEPVASASATPVTAPMTAPVATPVATPVAAASPMPVPPPVAVAPIMPAPVVSPAPAVVETNLPPSAPPSDPGTAPAREPAATGATPPVAPAEKSPESAAIDTLLTRDPAATNAVAPGSITPVPAAAAPPAAPPAPVDAPK